jgi:YVTN family beta-propeller protein
MRIEHAGRGGNSVSIVDIAQRKRLGTISLGEFHRPHGIDYDPASNQLAVSVELPDQLLICDAKSRSVVKRIDTQGKTAHMVSYSPDGKMAYVSNTSSDTVAAVNLANDSVKLIKVKARPEGSVFSKGGKELYVVCREAATISVIDVAKNAVVDEIRTSAGPVRIGSTPDGTLVYAAMHDKKVEFADPKARKVLGSVDLDGTPISLQVSPDGQYAFASGEEQDTVFIVSVPERKLVRQFKTGPGSGPDPVQLVK